MEHPKTIQEKIISAIKAGEVVMRPKWHFVLQGVLVCVGGIIAIIVLVYLMSLIMFGLRETGLMFIPGFGLQGTVVFLKSLPWILIILVGIFLIILEILVQRYAFAYKTPLLVVSAVIVLVAGVGGWAVARTPLHHMMIGRMSEFGIPVLGGAYRNIEYPAFKEMHSGRIIVMTPRGFDIENPHREVMMVVITPETKIFRRVQFHVGDRVVIMGHRDGSQIEASAVRRIPSMK
jgi:hypothetical protein